MVVNTTIKVLDIRDNVIPDESYKTLLAMLYRNESIRDIRYTLQNEQNLERMKKRKPIQYTHMPITIKQKQENKQIRRK